MHAEQGPEEGCAARVGPWRAIPATGRTPRTVIRLRRCPLTATVPSWLAPVDILAGFWAWRFVLDRMFRLFSSNLPTARRRNDLRSDAPGTVSIIPRHPTLNPHVPEGRYEAIVHDVQVWAYGNRDNHNEDLLIRIVLFLPDGDRYIVSDIDLPKIDWKVPFERLKQFAAVLGLNSRWILEDPGVATGRRLRVQIKPIDAQVSQAGRWYSDVHAFERCPDDET